MRISNITNNIKQNFKGCRWDAYSDVVVSKEQELYLTYMKELLNATEAQNMVIFLNAGKPNADAPEDVYVRVKTNILEDDFEAIKQKNPSVNRDMYKKHSKWFPFDKTLMHEVFEFVKMQNNLIRDCKKNPNHNPLA